MIHIYVHILLCIKLYAFDALHTCFEYIQKFILDQSKLSSISSKQTLIIKVCCEIKSKTIFSFQWISIDFSGTIFNLIWTYLDRNISYRRIKLYHKIKIYSVYFHHTQESCHQKQSFLLIYFPEFYFCITNIVLSHFNHYSFTTSYCIAFFDHHSLATCCECILLSSDLWLRLWWLSSILFATPSFEMCTKSIPRNFSR